MRPRLGIPNPVRLVMPKQTKLPTSIRILWGLFVADTLERLESYAPMFGQIYWTYQHGWNCGGWYLEMGEPVWFRPEGRHELPIRALNALLEALPVRYRPTCQTHMQDAQEALNRKFSSYSGVWQTLWSPNWDEIAVGGADIP